MRTRESIERHLLTRTKPAQWGAQAVLPDYAYDLLFVPVPKDDLMHISEEFNQEIGKLISSLVNPRSSDPSQSEHNGA